MRRSLSLFAAALLLVSQVTADAQPAQNVQGVGTASTPAGGAVSVNCVSGCSGGAGPGNVTVIAPLGVQTPAASVAVTNNGGTVGIDQTTPGTTNGVQVNAALPAGTNLVGKVGIDQTTPGTTNGVYVTNPSNIPVNVTVNSPPNDVLATATCTSTTGCSAAATVDAQGAGSVVVVATGSGTGLGFIFRGSQDNSNWTNLQAFTPAGVVIAPGTSQTANGAWVVPASGWRYVQVDETAQTGGTEVYNVNSSAGSVVPPGQTVNVTSGKITINSPPNDVTTGPTACNSTGSCTALTVSTQGSGSVGISLTGSGSGMAFTFQGSIDGTNWFAIGCLPPGLNPTPVSTGSANGNWFCPPAGYQLVRVDMTGFTSGTETITLNASAGSAQPVLGAVANAVELDGANGAALSATNPIFDAQVPITTGGLSVKSFIVANNTTSVAVKASAGQIYGITASSISAATPVFIKTYNIAQGSNTCGSNTPVQREMIPAPGVSGGGTNIQYQDGVAFGTAISVCVTAGQADNDTTSPAAASYIVNIYYK